MNDNLKLFHCDIKPDNILLDRYGNCKVADFGFVLPLGTYQNSESRAGTPNVCLFGNIAINDTLS
ncbi:hypothetical protein BD770DRAFT_391563 [Pilaira anomala]|nr:hypothetical protein BD770DRAFT_391563 [Pilaira anomala]